MCSSKREQLKRNQIKIRSGKNPMMIAESKRNCVPSFGMNWTERITIAIKIRSNCFGSVAETKTKEFFISFLKESLYIEPWIKAILIPPLWTASSLIPIVNLMNLLFSR